MARVGLFLFGYPRIELDGKVVEVDTRKAVALLAYLAMSRNSQSRDVLANLFWPDYDQSSARAALRRTLSVLNKATQSACLRIDREQVGLNDLWVDVLEFERCYEQGKASTLEDNTRLLVWAACIDLYRDRFMAGFSLRDSEEFDDWQFFQSESLNRLLADALQTSANLCIQLEEWQTGLEYARRWLALDPLVEDAHRLLMRLFAQSGQRNAALRQYRECVRILDQELGVAPLPETTSLYQSILGKQDAAGQKTVAVERLAAASFTPPQLHSDVEPVPLVGRDREQGILTSTYEQSRRRSQFALVEGETGIGKTRLAQAAVDQVGRHGAIVLRLLCYEGESNLAYAPLINGLGQLVVQPWAEKVLAHLPEITRREAARMVPAIYPPAANRFENPPEDLPGAQSRFLDSLRQVCWALLGAAPAPGVLFVDDLQWADVATLDLLAYLLRRLPEQGVLVLATCRGDLIAENERIQRMIADAQRGQFLTRLRLGRLSLDDLKRLANVAAPNLPGEIVEQLYRETEGLPYFAVQYLQSVSTAEQPEHMWEIPASVREVLRQRVQDAGETARQLLGAAAVIGHSFDYVALKWISGRSDLETVSGLETLLSKGLIVERVQPGEVMYDFTHEKLREFVYEDTSQARRRLLHQRAAEFLSSHFTRAGHGVEGVIARHFQAGGEDARAGIYYRMAGDQARQMYAHRDAIAHYQAALGTGVDDPASLHEIIGDLQVLIGEYTSAVSSYDLAASLSTPDALARIDQKIGNVHARLGQWDLAVSHYQTAVEADHRDCSACALASIYSDWSYVANQAGHTDESWRLAEKALQLAREGTDERVLGQVHNILGILSRGRGELSGAEDHLTRCLEIAEGSQDAGMRIAALNNLARLYAETGRLDEAITCARDAQVMCERLGDRHHEAALLNHLADLHHESGQPEQAMQYLKKAVAIFADIGIDAGTLNAEIWKLTEW